VPGAAVSQSMKAHCRAPMIRFQAARSWWATTHRIAVPGHWEAGAAYWAEKLGARVNGMHWMTAESLAVPGVERRPHAARWILLAGGLAWLLAGCGSAAPLVTHTQQAGMSECTPAPNLGAGIGLDGWKSAVGISVGMYYNQSQRPLTVRTVSLVGAHNMVLHGAMVYEMHQYRHPLPSMFRWEYGSKGSGVNSELVQQVPGAVIPPGIGPVANFVKQHPNVYEIGVDVSARKPGAAWADGVDVGYVANGHAEVLRLYIGFAIGAGPQPPAPNDDDPLCDKAMSAIQAAFQSLPGG